MTEERNHATWEELNHSPLRIRLRSHAFEECMTQKETAPYEKKHKEEAIHMTGNEKKILMARLIPAPREIKFHDGQYYVIQDDCCVIISVGSKESVVIAAIYDIFKEFWNIAPRLKIIECNEMISPLEGYRISVSEKSLDIVAVSMAGILNAMKTLRQLAEVERGVERYSCHFIPQCEIEDSPALEFRGIHICVFPETELYTIEKKIRLAAYYKLNYMVLELWGIFQFKSHPQMCWATNKISRTDIKTLINIGRSQGITIVPQFNLLGHASASRAVTGKHAILDFNPQLQSIFEPEGWSWCLTNPRTREILTDIVIELHEFFDNPPYFHIGCDEADNIGTCRDCRKRSLKELIKRHINHFHELLAKRKTRLIMWHDMLILKGDSRWKRYIACGVPEQNLEKLHKELPHDIVIADWQYTYPQEGRRKPTWPTSRFFKKEGFDVLVCPFLNMDGVRSLGSLAIKEKFKGMLETTWHTNNANKMFQCFYNTAKSTWESVPDFTAAPISSQLAFSFHLRQVGWDMNVTRYEETGSTAYQVLKDQYPVE